MDKATQALLPRIDTVVFDIDGVLLDITGSIRQVNILAIPAYLRTLPGSPRFSRLSFLGVKYERTMERWCSGVVETVDGAGRTL